MGLLTVLALGLLSNKASKPSPMWRASSSCSDTAVALARSLFRKGADFTSADGLRQSRPRTQYHYAGAPRLAADAGRFVGAPLMVVLLVLLFRTFLSRELLEEAKKQADRGVAGLMEGHAEMDMSVMEGQA